MRFETINPATGVSIRAYTFHTASDTDQIIASSYQVFGELANDTSYGLSSALWSGNVENAKRLATQIEAGAVFINDFSKSDPRIPIGGVKRSGFGRELSHFGIREFTNIKSVWIGNS